MVVVVVLVIAVRSVRMLVGAVLRVRVGVALRCCWFAVDDGMSLGVSLIWCGRSVASSSRNTVGEDCFGLMGFLASVFVPI